METFTEASLPLKKELTEPVIGSEPEEDGHEDCEPEKLIPLRIQTTRKRFVVLTVFAALNFVTQVQYVTFSTIVRETQERYHIAALVVNALCVIIPVIFVLCAYPGCLVYNKIGLWNGFLLAFALNTLAGGLKLISVAVPHVAFLVVAQICVGFAQLLSLGLASLVASVWFPVHERSLATSIGALFGFVGMAVGMFYSPFMVEVADDAVDWVVLWVTQTGFSAIFLLFHIATKFFISDRPEYPPALTSSAEYDKKPLSQGFKEVLKNKTFILLSLVFGVSAGFLTAVAAILAQLLEPFGISETTSGILAFSGILGGSFFCGVIGFMNDRVHAYKTTFIVLGAIVVVLLALLSAFASDSLKHHFPVASYVLVPLLECAVVPMVPNAVEMAAEITHPIPEHVSGTLILVSMCFFSIVGMVVFSIVLGDFPGTKETFGIALSLLVLSAICTVLFFFVDNDLRRQKLEQEEHSKSVQDD